MTVWTCPDCNREFGAVGRNHICTPGLSIDDFLAASPDFVEPVFQRVHGCLLDVDRIHGGNLIVDPLATKVLFKNGPTFCILDVKRRWVAVGFSLRRKLESHRLSRKTADYGGKFHHVVNVDDPQEIDDEFADWLAEAYLHGLEASTTGSASPSADPMVPDDVDFEINPAG